MKYGFMRISISLVALICATLMSVTLSFAQSTWEQIKSSGVLRQGVINYPPYWYRDPKTNEWTGAMVEMAQDIANELGVKLENVETTWAAAVLDLQSNKTDLQFSLQATPKRALVIDFAGPAYNVPYYAINSSGFSGRTWDEYNKEDVKIAGILGTSDVVILGRMTPKAEHLQLPDLAEVSLAVTSGRANAMVTTAFGALLSKEKNPNMGEIILPTPVISVPSYIGIRREEDQSFRNFLNAWSEWNVLMGYNETRLKDHLGSMGIKDIPDNIRF